MLPTASSQAAMEDSNRFLMHLPGGSAIEIRSECNLTDSDLNRIDRLVCSELKSGSSSIALLPKMLSEFKIKSFKIINNLPAEYFFEPPKGLECFDTLYKEIRGSESEKLTRDIVHGIINGHTIPVDKKYNASIYLVAMAEYVKVLEQKKEASTDELKLLKDYLIVLKKILDEELPDKIIPLHVVANICGVSNRLESPELGGFVLEGRLDKVAFCDSSISWLRECLGLHEIFSKEFAANLSECLSKLFLNRIEIGAGRGMLSASLNAVGKKVLYVSDILPPSRTWKSIKVSKKSAEDVTENYKDNYMKVIYLTSQSDIGMLRNLIKSEKPLFLLQTGFTYPKQLEEFEQTLKIVDLNIPGYSGHFTANSVRLLAANIPEAQFQEIIGKIPEQYRT